MKSPFTNGTVTEHAESMEITFRKESFTVVAQYYKCDDTGEEFTTTQQDGLAINQVYNQYREKYGIPFPEEINEILYKYGVSASKMSRILGFGDNQYLKYSKGEIPSVSNGKMISMIKDVSEFRKLLHLVQNEFTPNDIEKIERKIAHLQDNTISFYKQLIEDTTFEYNDKSIFTGYVSPKIEKIKNLILFFLDKCDGLFETKLNKLLFYSDFLCFKETGKGMSGLCYQAIQFGPIPVKYSTIYENVGGIETEIVIFPNGNTGKKLISKESFNRAIFTEDEINILERVLDKFKDHNASDISNVSHEEDAWIDNYQERNKIRYDYAFKLKAL